tara:strand:- start:2815 stop:3369 length:555 start_codon:yes stop_codon:yes gene_type:complete
MKKESKKLINIFLRYLLILVMSLGNLYIFYKVLSPLTINFLNLILSIFTKTQVLGNTIFLPTVTIEIVRACVAGAAFFLLFILILSTSDIKSKERLKILIISLITLFILNILRILFLILIRGNTYFVTIHWISWHLISILFVVIIWFLIVKKYNIKKIPLYSDLNYLYNLVKISKNSKKSKKKK